MGWPGWAKSSGSRLHGPEFQVKKLRTRPVKLTDLHKNAFGGRAPHGPAGGTLAFPMIP